MIVTEIGGKLFRGISSIVVLHFQTQGLVGLIVQGFQYTPSDRGIAALGQVTLAFASTHYHSPIKIMITPTTTVGTTKNANNPIISMLFPFTLYMLAQSIEFVNSIQHQTGRFLIGISFHTFQHPPQIIPMVSVIYDSADFSQLFCGCHVKPLPPILAVPS